MTSTAATTVVDHTATLAAATSTTTASRLAVAAVAAAGVAIGAAHVLNPQLDPSWTPISDLALGRHGWVMTAGFGAWALSGGAAVVSLRSHVHGRWGKLGLALTGIAACGPLLAGVFPGDPVTAPTDQASWHGMLHGVGALLSDALLPATVLLLLNLTRAGRPLRGARTPLAAVSAIVWGAAIWLTVQMATYLSAPGATLGPETPLGWANRVHVFACLLTFAAFAYAARRPANDR